MERPTARIGNNGSDNANATFLTTILLVCGLQALSRACGPFGGRIVAGVCGCIILVVAVVLIIVLVVQESNENSSNSSNSSLAARSVSQHQQHQQHQQHHAPYTWSWWVIDWWWIVLIVVVFTFSSPFLFWQPQPQQYVYVRRSDKAASAVVATVATVAATAATASEFAADGSVRPLLAVRV